MTRPRPTPLPALRHPFRSTLLCRTSQRPGPGPECSTTPAGTTGKAPPSCAPLVGPARANSCGSQTPLQHHALAAPASIPSLGSARNRFAAALARPPPPLHPLPPPPPLLPPPHSLLGGPGTASRCGSCWMARTNSPLLQMCAHSVRPASSWALGQSRAHPVLQPSIRGIGAPRAQRRSPWIRRRPSVSRAASPCTGL